MENILLFLILGLTFISALSQIFILLLNSSKHKPEDQSTEELDTPSIDKSQKLIHDAQEKALKILTNAELKGIEFLSKQKLDTQKIQDEYVKNIKALEVKLTNQFRESLDRADKTYQGFLDVLQENLRQEEIKNQKILEEKAGKLVDSAQTAMMTFIAGMNNKVGKQIDEELKAVRNELDMYKTHRMEILNKYVIDILERTLEETLGKKLTLDEHSELIFEALEKAKNEQKLK